MSGFSDFSRPELESAAQTTLQEAVRVLSERPVLARCYIRQALAIANDLVEREARQRGSN